MRTILITGASGGLAQEMVKLLPEDRLILLGRNQEKLEKLYASHPQAECIEIDITDSSAVQDLVEELYQRYGQIDILVNNAGYGIFEEFDQITNEQIHAMFEVNTFALMQLSRLMGAHMKEAGKGHIVNIVSMAGLVATAKSSLYSATKFAAIGFSNALRLELMPFGVHVTTVNPGPIRTTFFDQADPDRSYVKAVDRYILEPDFVAKKIVKKMIGMGKNILGARVLVMGVTFKENVSDIRNSKVVDIVNELKDFGVDVDVTDPNADSEEVMHEYGFKLIEKPRANYDAVIVAVAHKEYMDLDEGYFRGLTYEHAVLGDIKGIYRGKIHLMKYWSL